MYGYSSNFTGSPRPTASDTSISAGGFQATVVDTDKIWGKDIICLLLGNLKIYYNCV